MIHATLTVLTSVMFSVSLEARLKHVLDVDNNWKKDVEYLKERVAQQLPVCWIVHITFTLFDVDIGLEKWKKGGVQLRDSLRIL